MSYDIHASQRLAYVRMHVQELCAEAEQIRRARQIHRPRRVRRYVGTLLIAAGESLVCPQCEPARAHR